MVGSRFIRTVTYGGYDKADVLRALDSLNEQLFGLKNELRETKLLLDSNSDSKDIKEAIETLLAEERAKLTEVQTENESLSSRLKTAEEANQKYEDEIKELKAALDDATSKLKAANADDKAAAMKSLLSEAKTKAAELEGRAAAAAERSVAYANDESAMIIYEAQCKAAEIIADAKNTAADEKAASLADMRESALSKLSSLSEQLSGIKDALSKFNENSVGEIAECENILGKTEETFKESESSGETVRFAPEYPERPQRTAPLDEEKPIIKPEPETAQEDEAPEAEEEAAHAEDAPAEDAAEPSEPEKPSDKAEKAPEDSSSDDSSKKGKIDLASLMKQAKALKEKT